jgi:SAM-dependent methyltransferase
MERDAGSGATYSAEQFAPLFVAEDRQFWFRSRNRCIGAVLRLLPEFSAIRDVLEVGCGTGVVLAELQPLFPAGRVIGMDLFEGMSRSRKPAQPCKLRWPTFKPIGSIYTTKMSIDKAVALAAVRWNPSTTNCKTSLACISHRIF